MRSSDRVRGNINVSKTLTVFLASSLKFSEQCKCSVAPCCSCKTQRKHFKSMSNFLWNIWIIEEIEHYLSLDIRMATLLADALHAALQSLAGVLVLKWQFMQGLVPIVPGVLLLFAIAVGLGHSPQVTRRYVSFFCV